MNFREQVQKFCKFQEILYIAHMKLDVNVKIRITGIYKIVNIVNGKIYIGSALNIYNRIFGSSSISHLKALKNNNHINKKLQNSFNKYGEDSFEFFIVEKCIKEELLIREQYYLDTLCFAKNYKKFSKYSFNICPNAGSPLGKKASNKTKKILSISKKGNKNPMFGKTGELNNRSIKILQYSKKGDFIRCWVSKEKASNTLNISKSSINNSIFSFKKTGGKFYWRKFLEKYPLKIEINEKLLRENENGMIPLKAINNTDNSVLEFSSFNEASVYFNMSTSYFSKKIKESINNKKSYKNYDWRYALI